MKHYFPLLLLIICLSSCDLRTPCGENKVIDEHGVCGCNYFYEGTECDVRKLEKYLGVYKGTIHSSINPHKDTLILNITAPDSSEVLALIQPSNIFLKLNSDGTADIPEVDNSMEYEVRAGSVILSNDQAQISISYTLEYADSSRIDYFFTGRKQ